MNRMILLSLLLLPLGTQASHSRLLLESIAGYDPTSVVTDENAIDLDQKSIVSLVAGKNDTSFAAALKVYQEGGYTKSYAELSITPLSKALTAGTKIEGNSDTDAAVTGTLRADAGIGATKISVQYDVKDIQAVYSTCQVGGLPTPNVVGCFKASGSITIDGILLPVLYTYDPLADNNNGITIQGMSKGAETYFKTNGAGSYYPDFQKFFDYFQTADFGDKIVTSAFGGTPITFPVGTFDYSLFGFEGREEATKKSTLYFNIVLYMIGTLEKAIDECVKGSATAKALNLLDTAVAFYTGSSELSDGVPSGYLLHQLADSRCANFKVCVDGTQLTGKAKVTTEIFDLFNKMKNDISGNQCESARASKNIIAQKSFLPITQGAVRYSYINSLPTSSDKARGELFTFATAVLPIVAKCNNDDATTIFNNVKPGVALPIKVDLVKSLFEKHYSCMGFTCADVGGLYDASNSTYFPGMSPCVEGSSTAAPTPTPLPACRRFCFLQRSSNCCTRFRKRLNRCDCQE